MKTRLLGATLGLLAAAPAVAQAALPTGNLLANPGFEQGPATTFTSDPLPIPSWTTTAPARVRVVALAPADSSLDSYHADQVPGGGCRGLLGPLTPHEADDASAGYTDYSGFQDVPLSAEAAGKTLRLGALLGRYGQSGSSSLDYGYAQVDFLDASGATLRDAAAEIDDYSSTPATAAELQRKDATTSAVPAGAAIARVFVDSVAVGFGAGRGPANGLVDDVKLTFDAALPADPSPGCQQAVPTTGAASAITTQSARLDGTIDTKHEDVRYFFRYGKGGVLDLSAGEAELAAADGSSPVSQSLTNLDAASTYSYALVARTTIDDTTGAETVGPVRTFTTPAPPVAPQPPGVFVTPFTGKIYKGNTFAGAVTISRPKGGCVKPGTTFTVSVADKAEGTRTLRRFVVQSKDGIHKDKTTIGPVGRTSGTVKVKKLYVRAPKHTRGQRMILSVFADFNGIQDPRGAAFGTLDGSPDSVSGQKQFKFCSAAKPRRAKKR